MITPHETPSRPCSTLVLSGPPLPVDLEFKEHELSRIFGKAGLSFGRCFGSKSGYRRANRKAVFIPNGNVFCRTHGKIWWGDLDLNCDKPALEKVARRLRCRLYVLREHDGRFEKADLPFDAVRRAALWHTGGPTRVSCLGRIRRRTGLSLKQLARFANLKPAHLTGWQPPEIALEAQRQLLGFEESYGAVAAALGSKKWGAWWRAPNVRLGGQSPLTAFTSGRPICFEELTRDIKAQRWLNYWKLALTLVSKKVVTTKPTTPTA